MIFATGDTHGKFRRFMPKHFPEQTHMTKDDYMIICGDFGGVWDGGERDKQDLDWLERLPFTTLFVSGNHENFDALGRYPVEKWKGGKVQKLRPHVIHLMRGQVFDIEGYTFFTMGGASSHDIADGILDPGAPDFKEQYRRMHRNGAMFRVNHYSWWEQESPSQEEYEEARRNMERVNYEVDYIVTHCAPSSIEDSLSDGAYSHNQLTGFLEEIKQRSTFHSWLCGHYHVHKTIDQQFIVLWEQIVQVV